MKSKPLIFQILLYLSSALILVNFYRYQISPDTISYIDIAQKYATADYANAINGTWGPMFSWLLIPFLKLGSDPLLSAIVINIISGLFLLILLNKLMETFEISPPIKVITTLSATPLFIQSAVRVVTPDLLLTTLIALYFYLVIQKNFTKNPIYWITSGLVAGFAYLTKAYALPFFIFHFLIINLIHHQRLNLSLYQTLRCLIVGYSFFLVVVLPWIALISLKYGYLTFTNSFAHNYSLEGPNAQIINTKILIPPPNPTATSILEDVSYLPDYIPLELWNPFQSTQNLLLQIEIILRNIYRSMTILLNFSIISIPVLAFFFAKTLTKPLKISLRDPSFMAQTTILTYPLGYLLLHVESRYLLPIIILILILSAKVLGGLLEKPPKLKKVALIAIFVSSFSFIPIRNLVIYFNLGKDFYTFSQTLKERYYLKGTNLASNSERVGSLSLAYFTNSHYFGQTESTDKVAFTDELRNYQIDYYLYWGESQETLLLSENLKQIIYSPFPLKIYKTKF